MTQQAGATEINPEVAPGWLSGIKAWVLDVDGCLVSTARPGGMGGVAFKGAAEFIATVKAAGHTVVVCTNASQKTPAQYAEHLRAIGLDITDEEFMTAGLAAAEYVATFHPGQRTFFLADEGITEPAKNLGIQSVSPEDTELADIVVVGAVEAVTKAQLNAAALAVDAGAPLYSTVVSPWFHGGQGKSVTMSSAVAAAVGYGSNTAAEVVGKPSKALADTLRVRFGIDPSQIAVVGDAPAEIGLARHMGARSITVFSGALSAQDIRTDNQPQGQHSPDLAVTNIGALHTLCDF